MINGHSDITCTAFLGTRMVASGSLPSVISMVKETMEEKELLQLLVFDDSTGKQIDVEFRGKTDDLAADESPRRAGRPKLGVVSGEITLLPRHWEWLKDQPGGASVTLRKLIDEARRAGEEQGKIRASQESVYHFMTAVAGNFPHYEEALRELYSGDADRFYDSMEEWAPDIKSHIKKLALDAFPNRNPG
jgi:hypothetical protein